MPNCPILHRKLPCSCSWWRNEHYSQGPLCFVFRGLDGVADLLSGEVKKWLHYSEQTSEVTTAFFPGAAWTQMCSCCSFRFSNLLSLGALLEPWGIMVVPPSRWVDQGVSEGCPNSVFIPWGNKVLSRRGVAGEECWSMGIDVLWAGMDGPAWRGPAPLTCSLVFTLKPCKEADSEGALTMWKQVTWEQTPQQPVEGSNCLAVPKLDRFPPGIYSVEALIPWTGQCPGMCGGLFKYTGENKECFCLLWRGEASRIALCALAWSRFYFGSVCCSLIPLLAYMHVLRTWS